jgi:hypothetical protein
MANAHVMIADITGSTTLYDQVSDAEALVQISKVLARMRTIIEENNGHCVKSQGDDTLSFFPEADQVFRAASTMIQTDWPFGLDVHIGAYWGNVVRHESDIYGDAVNTTARLASLAKPGELLIGDTVFEQISTAYRSLFVSMGGLKLKGKSQATRVHSFTVSELEVQTVFFSAKASNVGRRTESVELTLDDSNWTLIDGQNVIVGRSPDCEAVLEQPWVSRKHGKFELRAAQLEYTDHSSSGSTVVTSDGREFSLQRRSMLLNGEGKVLIGTSDPDMAGSVIHYATNDLVPDDL